MSNTKRDKIKAKCKLKIMKWKDAPMFMQNKWDRYNNEWGEFRALRKELKEKIMNKEMKNYESNVY